MQRKFLIVGLLAFMLPMTLAIAAQKELVAVQALFSDGSATNVTNTSTMAAAQATLAAQASTQPAAVVLPAPLPAPVALPKRTARIAPATHKGDGVSWVGGGKAKTLTNYLISGWDQNIVCQNLPAVMLSNVVSINAYRAEASEQFNGQGGYFDNVKAVTINGCVFDGNGWQPGLPPKEDSTYRHDNYHQFNSAAPAISGCVFARAPCAGCQLRAGGTISDCVFLDNGIAVLAVMGPVTLSHCTIYGGNFYTAISLKNGQYVVTALTANCAVYTYTTITMDDVWIVGRPGQGTRPAAMPVVPVYPSGCIATAVNYPKAEWKPPVDAHGNKVTDLIDAQDCVIAGQWPGGNFTGALTTSESGFDQRDTPAVAYNYLPILEAVESNPPTMTIPAAVAKLHGDIRGLVQ